MHLFALYIATSSQLGYSKLILNYLIKYLKKTRIVFMRSDR